MTEFDASTTAVADISGDYAIDTAHTRLGFVARHAMVTKVRGQFKEFSGTAHVDTATPANSKVDISISADSIDTGVPDRDGHLRSADFFGTAENPTIIFVSNDVSRDGSEWTVAGDLTIKGTSVPVTIEFDEVGSARDPYGNLRVGFEGGATINRSDWGLSFNAVLETGGVLVSDKIRLEFDIAAVQKD